MSTTGQSNTIRHDARHELAGRVALVVGGSRGIGLALAQELIRRGCQVAVASRGDGASDELTAAARYTGCDVRSAADVDKLFDALIARFGQLDLVVNCAGIGRSSRARSVPSPAVTLDEHEWQDVLDTNLRGGFLVARAAARAMLPRRSGQIVNISSARGARRGQPFGAAYCASKMATLEMFRAMAEELAPLGIRVWSLLPDAVDTQLIAGTHLAKRGSLSAAGLARIICDFVQLPYDAQLIDPLVAPWGAPELAEAGR